MHVHVLFILECNGFVWARGLYWTVKGCHCADWWREKNEGTIIKRYTILCSLSLFLKLSGSEHKIDPDKLPKADFVFPETIKNFEQLPLEFQGFCAFHLTTNDRLLVPAVPDIGVLQYRERFYGFSSREAAIVFAKSPD